MSRPPAARGRKPREGLPGEACQPCPQEGPSVGTIIAGIAGLAGAIGLGYLLGTATRDEEEEQREAQRQAEAQRRQQRLLQEQLQRRQQASTRASSSSFYSTGSAQQLAGKPYEQSGRLGPPIAPAVSASDSGVVISAFAAASGPSASSGTGSSQQDEDATLCKVCYDAKMDCVLFPCRHQCCCSHCSQQLIECPICRQPISSAERIFLA